MPTVIPIADPDDLRVAAYRDVRERDLVGRHGLFMAEGKVVIEKLVADSAYEMVSLLVAAKRVAALESILARLPETVPVFAGAQPVIDAIAGFSIHRGLLAIGRRSESPTADALLRNVTDANGSSGHVLLLCGIANHDNMGGIFRNAAAFGIRAVLLDADCCDPLYRKAIRVSVGAALMVPFARLTRGEDAPALLDRYGYASVALSPTGATLLHDWRPGPQVAILLGAEGPGLEPEILTRMQSVRIAMAGGFDSLNVATTSGIVLHHVSSGRGGGR